MLLSVYVEKYLWVGHRPNQVVNGLGKQYIIKIVFSLHMEMPATHSRGLVFTSLFQGTAMGAGEVKSMLLRIQAFFFY